MNVVRKVCKKYNSLLGRVSMETGLNLNKPDYICAKMTMRCNSRCVHCNIWDMEHGEIEMTGDQWRTTLTRLRSWLGSFRMVFTGGEALLRDDMTDILEHAVGLGIEVELLSNSIILNDRMAARLVEIGIAQLTTSFDGITPETHDRFRGTDGLHALTCTAVESLCLARKEQKKALRILLKTVISRNNLAELPEIVRWAWAHDVEIMFQPIEQNYGEETDRNWYRRSPWWITDIPQLKECLYELKSLHVQGAPIVNTLDEFDTMVRYFECPDELMDSIQAHNTGAKPGKCPHAVTNFVISSNGDVRMCFRMAPVGNLTSQSPEEIWKNRERCWAGPCDYR
jgi:MoaA/NifB/PqqE/SkfB family radical SAM enzyme